MKLFDKQQIKSQGDAMMNLAKENSVKFAEKYHEKYLNFSTLTLFILLVFNIILGNLFYGLLIFGFIHMHIGNNQLWYKVRTIEAFLEDKLK